MIRKIEMIALKPKKKDWNRSTRMQFLLRKINRGILKQKIQVRCSKEKQIMSLRIVVMF